MKFEKLIDKYFKAIQNYEGDKNEEFYLRIRSHLWLEMVSEMCLEELAEVIFSDEFEDENAYMHIQKNKKCCGII